MKRTVSVSQHIADELVKLNQQAEAQGKGKSFRRAWRKIWAALHRRPLPPDESAQVFGELCYRTKNFPRHAHSIASVLPILIRFAVCEEETVIAGEVTEVVFLTKISLMA